MRHFAKTIGLFLFAGAVLAVFQTPLPGQQPGDDPLRVEILIKLLALNRSINFDHIDSLRIVIAFEPADSASVRRADIYHQLLEAYRDPPLRGKRIFVQRHSIHRDAGIIWESAHAVLVLSDPGRPIDTLLRACAAADVLSLAIDSTLINSGVAVAVEVGPGSQPDIWFNISAISDAGGIYDSEVLELVHHVIW